MVSLKSTVSCGTTPMAALRLAWLKLLTSSPPTITEPSLTSNSRNRSLATVVLPLPELGQENYSCLGPGSSNLPTRAVVVPLAILKETSLREKRRRNDGFSRMAYLRIVLQGE